MPVLAVEVPLFNDRRELAGDREANIHAQITDRLIGVSQWATEAREAVGRPCRA